MTKFGHGPTNFKDVIDYLCNKPETHFQKQKRGCLDSERLDRWCLAESPYDWRHATSWILVFSQCKKCNNFHNIHHDGSIPVGLALNTHGGEWFWRIPCYSSFPTTPVSSKIMQESSGFFHPDYVCINWMDPVNTKRLLRLAQSKPGVVGKLKGIGPQNHSPPCV